MKFDELPSEMTEKILSYCDHETFFSAIYANKKTCAISKKKQFGNFWPTSLLLDKKEQYVCYCDGSSLLVASAELQHTPDDRKQWISYRNRVKRVEKFVFKNLTCSGGLIENIIPIRFRNLRAIDHLEFENCSFDYSCCDEVAAKYKVKNLKILNCTGLRGIIGKQPVKKSFGSEDRHIPFSFEKDYEETPIKQENN